MGSAWLPHLSKSLSAAIRWLETALLCVLLFGMVSLYALQIALRNWFNSGLPWIDDLVRLGVLWIAVVGAMAASGDNRHISINLISRYGPAAWHRPAALVATAFASLVTALIAWQTSVFVIDSYQYEDLLLEGVPAWPLQLIIPVGFTVICYRMFARFVTLLRKAP